MDELQIKHAFDQIEMYQGQLRNYLIDGPLSNQKVNDLESRIADLKEELGDVERDKDSIEDDRDNLQSSAEKVKAILEDLISQDAGFDYVKERVLEALELL